jgi:hypothetical protein
LGLFAKKWAIIGNKRFTYCLVKMHPRKLVKAFSLASFKFIFVVLRNQIISHPMQNRSVGNPQWA